MKEEFYKQNSYYEGLLQNYYCGKKGCFAAFMTFFYQYNQSLVFSKELSMCFKRLYEIELENCQILSELILRIGGDNKYYSNSKKFLSGYNVDYIKNFDKAFLSDVEMLEVGEIQVKDLILKIENGRIKNKLKQILFNKKNELKILKENYFKNKIIS